MDVVYSNFWGCQHASLHWADSWDAGFHSALDNLCPRSSLPMSKPGSWRLPFARCVSYSCCDQLPQTRTVGFHCLKAVEIRSLLLKCQSDLCPSSKNWLSYSSFAGNWQSSECDSSGQPSWNLALSTQKLLPSVYDIMPWDNTHLNSVRPHCSLVMLQTIHSPKRSRSQRSGLCNFWGSLFSPVLHDPHTLLIHHLFQRPGHFMFFTLWLLWKQQHPWGQPQPV